MDVTTETVETGTNWLAQVKRFGLNLEPGLGGRTEVISFIDQSGSGAWVACRSVRGYGVVRTDMYGYMHLYLDVRFETPGEASAAALALHYEYNAMIERAVARKRGA